uniref:Uncharacterized protein n=1 Tax=Noctiluca scintillans TaxID=2966 RepID=A0A7S1ARU8_NOCSC|mmetsp:Transcript_56339/g.150652  ORF Transcript_56339/g.150652 Transcript_56339/m.150652 type:complete len:209 (+) Transcript_56339:49-675(+)
MVCDGFVVCAAARGGPCASRPEDVRHSSPRACDGTYCAVALSATFATDLPEELEAATSSNERLLDHDSDARERSLWLLPWRKLPPGAMDVAARSIQCAPGMVVEHVWQLAEMSHGYDTRSRQPAGSQTTHSRQDDTDDEVVAIGECSLGPGPGEERWLLLSACDAPLPFSVRATATKRKKLESSSDLVKRHLESTLKEQVEAGQACQT